MFRYCSLGLALFLVPFVSYAASWQVNPAKSLFAIVTLKDGFAAKFAHDHFVTAQNYKATLDIPAESESSDTPADGRFALSLQVSELEVDNPKDRENWSPLLKQYGIVKETLAPISESDRKSIRENMLDKSQLDGEKFPEIAARAHSLEAAKGKMGAVDFSHTLTLEMTVKGKTVSKRIPARFKKESDGKSVVGEAVGQFKFTEFGIKPYSAFMGAAKNRDGFYVVVKVSAEKQ